MDADQELLDACNARLGRELNGKWRLQSLLGVGGMAAVYGAVHRNGSVSAIKMLHAELAAIPDARARFLKEAYIANKVGHPGTVMVIDDDTDADTHAPYLVMELLSGETIAARAQASNGRLGTPEVLAIAELVLEVLIAAHEKGVVHRDIKPDNLFVTTAGVLKLLDFGVARLREDATVRNTATATGIALGTPAFMAPEQALGRWADVDARTDLWGLGATMFVLLSGRFVHEGENPSEVLVAAATRPARSLARIVPEAPVALVRIVDRALAFDRSQRYASAQAMRVDVVAARGATRPSIPAAKPRPVRRVSGGHEVDLSGGSFTPTVPYIEPPPSKKPSAPVAMELDLDLGRRRSDAPPLQLEDVGRKRPGDFELAPQQRRAEPPPAFDRRAEPASTRSAGLRALAGPPTQESTGRGPVNQGAAKAIPDIPDLALGAVLPSKPVAIGPHARPSTEPPPRLSSEPPPKIAQAPRLPAIEPLKSEPPLARSVPPVSSRSPEVAIVQTPISSLSEGAPRPPLTRALSVQMQAPVISSRPPTGAVEGGEPSSRVTALRELFKELEKALIGRAQYGASHVETQRRVERVHQGALMALGGDVALSAAVSPYFLHLDGESIWEPAAPLDAIPYRLFSSGVRSLGFRRGLELGEVNELIRLLTLDPVTEIAPEDDLSTLIWDACFTHIVHEAIDAFAEGDQEERAAFERERRKVLGLVRFETPDQLEDCWAERAKDQQDFTGRQRRLVGALLRAPGQEGSPQSRRAGQDGSALSRLPDTESLARADNALSAGERARGQGALAAGAEGGAELSFDIDPMACADRLVLAVARAYETERARGDVERLVAALRVAVDGLAIRSPRAAMELVAGLCRSIRGRSDDDGERARAELAASLLSIETVRALITGKLDPRDVPVIARCFSIVLRQFDGALVPMVLDVFPTIEEPQLREELIAYLSRTGRGYETRIGGIVSAADVEPALAMIRVLLALQSPKAHEAIALGARSPHPLVRIEVIGHLEGAGAERIRNELRLVLEDKDPTVRLTALKVIEHNKIRAAGPYLVLRIKSPAFDELPVDERRQALATLGTLMRSRAESVCVEIVRESRLVPSLAHDASREIAAEVLGEIASTQEIVDELQEVAKKRWRNSERVRAAATRAAVAVASRARLGIAPAPGSDPGPSKEPK